MLLFALCQFLMKDAQMMDRKKYQWPVLPPIRYSMAKTWKY